MIYYCRPNQDILHALGERAQQLRLIRGLRQEELAARAGVGIATVRRFEKTGAASIQNVLRIATALGAELAFDNLFEAPQFASIDEALSRSAITRRRRAARSK